MHLINRARAGAAGQVGVPGDLPDWQGRAVSRTIVADGSWVVTPKETHPPGRVVSAKMRVPICRRSAGVSRGLARCEDAAD